MVQPFSRSGSGTLHVRTCKEGSNLLLHATLITNPHQNTKFERDRFSRSRDLERPLPCTCARAAALQLWHMDMHCLVGSYLHAKFQRNRPSSYQDLAIGTKLTPLRFARGTCIRGYGHLYTSTIVQYLVEGMRLPYKNYRK